MKSYKNIIKLYFSSMESFDEIKKTPKDFGTGDLLYGSEIHTIVAIGKNPGSNMTEIARIMDITKGGVQKFTKKLLAKDLIYKTHLPDNKKEVIFGLTKKGNIAFKMHEDFEQRRFGKIYDVMDAMEEKELQVLEDFLTKLNEILLAGE
ncbi:MarR family winged helix-turn-helix transcriptional regulator [Vallitalea guaymasensis]|uniref:MarR family transcriptional regulator n=1 Tax=Vallitalea guaymasensis TaxID=1185412 RepID=A0A8J8SEB2_9FIRM|nr:MarR family transcriptional regulator [Vallitalea guaymasensis]QUH31360.1 MarR family transcriptional regulator [Vallitalea guaymasensis]